MTPSLRTDRLKLAIIATLLIASIPSFLLIPFGPYWGMDLQNLFAFHHCAARNNPYLGSGAVCGDVGGRDMFYPPALYWSFSWLRLVSFETGVALWSIVIGGGLLLSLGAWIPARVWRDPGAGGIGLFLGLLTAQFPVLFAMERGNNDILVLLAWTGALRLYLAGAAPAAGFLSVVAVGLKLYPVFACAILLIGFGWSSIGSTGQLQRFAKYAAGGGLAAVVMLAAFYQQTRIYIADQLPRFAGAPRLPPLVFSHTLDGLASGWRSWALKVALLALWGVTAARRLRQDPALVFAGALAISTFFSSVSFDYNLLTTYPLLVLLFLRSRGDDRLGALAFALLVMGLGSVISGRFQLGRGPGMLQARLATQWLWLIITALAAGWLTPRPTAGENGPAGEPARA